MFNSDNSIINEGDIITFDNRKEYQPLFDETKGVISAFKGYDIQTVNIQPNDVILLHLNDDIDVETISSLLEEMNKIFPENTIIPVNEWVLKGMTILRQSKNIADSVNEVFLDKPAEELFSDIFNNKTTAPKGGVIW